MRVAYACCDHGVPVFGRKGPSEHVQAVLRTLVARGDEVHLLTTAPVGTPPPELAQVRVHHLPTGPSTDRAGREVYEYLGRGCRWSPATSAASPTFSTTAGSASSSSPVTPPGWRRPSPTCAQTPRAARRSGGPPRLRAVARHDWSSVVCSALSLSRVGVEEVPRAASR